MRSAGSAGEVVAARIEHYGRAPEEREESFVMPTTAEEVEKPSWGQLLYLAGEHSDELGNGGRRTEL